MKTKVLAFAIGIVSLASFSAGAQTVSGKKDFTSFTGINISDMFTVSVRQADYYGADWLVDSALRDYVLVGMKGSELVVTLDRKSFDKETKKLYAGKKANNAVLKLTVYAPSLTSVSVSDNVSIDMSKIDIETANFNLDATDNAVVTGLAVNASSATVTASKKAEVKDAVIDAGNLSINTLNSAVATVDHISKSLSVQTSGTSTANISGDCEGIEVTSQNSSKLNIKGSALGMNLNAGGREVHAEDLKVSDIAVVGSNGCKAYIFPEENLSLDLKGGCLVSFGGRPVIDIVNIQNSSVSHL